MVWRPAFLCKQSGPHAGLQPVQMSLQQRSQVSNVMTFKYARGPAVTILVSKSAGRYRVQSDTFEAMWLVVQVLHCLTPAMLHKFYLSVHYDVQLSLLHQVHLSLLSSQGDGGTTT